MGTWVNYLQSCVFITHGHVLRNKHRVGVFLLVFDLWKMSSVCKCVAVRPCSHLLFLGREKFVTAHLHRVIGVVFSQKNSFAHNRFIWAVNHLATSRDFIRLAALCRNISSEWSGRLNLELTGWCCTQSAAVPFIYGHINGGLRRDYRTRRVVSIELNRHFTNISSHLIDCSRRRCELNGCHHRRHQTAGNGSTFAYTSPNNFKKKRNCYWPNRSRTWWRKQINWVTSLRNKEPRCAGGPHRSMPTEAIAICGHTAFPWKNSYSSVGTAMTAVDKVEWSTVHKSGASVTPPPCPGESVPDHPVAERSRKFDRIQSSPTMFHRWTNPIDLVWVDQFEVGGKCGIHKVPVGHKTEVLSHLTFKLKCPPKMHFAAGWKIQLPIVKWLTPPDGESSSLIAAI